MVFNWFRRQFDKASSQAVEEEQKATQTGQEESAIATDLEIETEGEKSASSAEDNLNWAKAAYQNIQQTQVESSASTDSPSITEARAGEDASPTAGEDASPTAGEDASPAGGDASPAGGDARPTVPGSESKKPKSFLELASSQRQVRIEELKERAIAEPEPEPEPKPESEALVSEVTPETSSEEIAIAFDEGFLWSAEVLKAQGRPADRVSVEEITWLKRLRQGLGKTRLSLINKLKEIVGSGPLNQDGVMEIEALLLSADVGVQACDRIIEKLQAKLKTETLPPSAAIAYLKQILRDMLDNPGGMRSEKNFAPQKDTLNIWMMTGVNGVGKTTTIGKLAHLAQRSNYRCLIGAADTFRAAAVEQVKVWGDRSGTEVIANKGKNTDPAAVVFDAIAAAQARNIELLLVDTAGRLQNKQNLMEELSKIRRIIQRKAPDARVESLLVLDATLGQNGLRQAEVFCEAAKLSGVVLTKLDGTAKGGVALAVVEQLGLPIRFIGAGEGIEDLRPFSSYEFVEALISG